MKKTIVALCVVFLIASVGLFAQASAEKQIVLKLSEVHAEGYPTTMADYEFARLVEERTNGRIKIEVYSGGTLYGQETGAVEALQVGDLAFARVSTSPVASYVDALNAIQMPYLYNNGEHMWAVLNGSVGQNLLADVEKSGSGLIGLLLRCRRSLLLHHQAGSLSRRHGRSEDSSAEQPDDGAYGRAARRCWRDRNRPQ